MRWSLPVTQSGLYRIFVQIPAVSDAASNVAFNVSSGGTTVSSVAFQSGLPPLQWAHLATPVLDAALSNSLEMIVTPGTGQSNAVALADVIRVTALVPGRPFIGDVQGDAGDTTANITWTTLAPTATRW